jgi:hypothetical protein
MKKFYWSLETLQYFKKNQKEIADFVKYECDLEEGETEEMLIEDLQKQSKAV